jgi:hypothetical protein
MAPANKLARIVWTVLRHGREFERAGVVTSARAGVRPAAPATRWALDVCFGMGSDCGVVPTLLVLRRSKIVSVATPVTAP